MNADDAMRSALSAAVDPIARRASKKLRKALRGDPEAVHDARTGLRRLREGLAILGRAGFDPERAAAFGKGLRHIERALGPTRDDDVLLAHLSTWIDRSGPRAAGIAPLRERLVAKRAKHARAMTEVLRRRCAAQDLRDLRRWLDAAGRETHGHRLEGPRGPVRRLVGDETRQAYAQIAAFGRGGRASLDSIHRFRSACRRLRLALELFGGALRAPDRVIDPLHLLQDRLGELHDHAVAVARVERWLARSRVPSTKAIRTYLAERVRSRDRLRNEFGGDRRIVVAPAFRLALFSMFGDDVRAPARALARPGGS